MCEGLQKRTATRKLRFAAEQAAVAEPLETRALLSASLGTVAWRSAPIVEHTSVTPPSTAAAAAIAAPVKVNFQPSSAAGVAGYLPDSGQTFATRNGQSYGWSADHTGTVFDRQINANQLLDTVAAVKAAARWELAVPNGQYTVKVSVGDAAATSRNNVWIEGVQVFNYVSLAANTFSNKAVTVNVSDGRLTLGIGSAPAGTVKINFLEVSGAAVSPPPVSPPPTSPPPVSPPPSSLGLAAPVVSASATGTSTLAVNWNAPNATDAAKIARYSIRYVVGAYKTGPAGQPQTVEVPVGQTGVTLSGLFPFELYSIEVRAIDSAGGGSSAGRTTIYT